MKPLLWTHLDAVDDPALAATFQDCQGYPRFHNATLVALPWY